MDATTALQLLLLLLPLTLPIPIAPAATPPLPLSLLWWSRRSFGQPVRALALIRACAAVRLDSPRSCSLALVHACPAVRARACWCLFGFVHAFVRACSRLFGLLCLHQIHS